MIILLALALVVAGALLAPVPARWVERITTFAFWRRRPVRERLQQRRMIVLSYLGLVAIVLVVWTLPSLLTRHPEITEPADRHQAITDTRTGLVALLAGMGAAGGLAYTARTLRLGQENYQLDSQGQITDRYSKALAQLGDDKIEIRLGGIFAQERLMRDSEADQSTIMETLAAFVRQHFPHTLQPAVRRQTAPWWMPVHPPPRTCKQFSPCSAADVPCPTSGPSI